ncbi:LysR family transcriptional regulator [Pseudovibrio sp. SPO723]|uniref:LysR family transcriptional regulator n=1 Tax=Nesiotobacter zosterae TaxID=392721 RepID=UPI0029C251FC|nr:LysR family transcriptional regulator [Pseudovibrio sp. SPO723]MDX5595740.1 LysR family transcriptional regulator [Pseudovibrio sp. SPO723]
MGAMIPRLTISHLALLSAIAETRSLTAAAARLGITQSAASHRLKEAERRIGFRLLRRAEKVVTLTPEGEKIRAMSEQFLDELARLEQELEASYNGKQILVRLGQATYSRYHWLPAFLAHLEVAEPQLTVDLSGSSTSKPLSSLSQGTVDVVTMYGRPSPLPKFRWFNLGADPLVAVMAPDHRLAELPFVDSSHLVEERYYAYPISSEPGFEWQTVIGVPDTMYRNITHMPTPEAVIDLVRAGFGVGVFSRWAVEPEIADGTLIAKPLGENGFSLDWWAVMRASDPENGAGGRLARALASWNDRLDNGMGTLAF